MKEFDFKGRVYIVTGSSSGIGKSCAEQLLSCGAAVYGVDLNESSIESSSYKHYRISVADEAGINSVVEDVSKSHGKIDGLVNAAGIWGSGAPFYEMDSATWEKLLSVNLTGVFLTSKSVSRAMIPNKKGKIVNISCIRSSVFRSNMADYAASKGGVVALTSAMALDLAPFGIQVNSVAPGFTYTGMTQKSFDNEEVRKQSEALIPSGRLGQPEDISNVVLFLLSDMSDYMTGTNVFADGGYHIQK